MTTKSQDQATDVAALLRARNPLLWIVTREEARVEQYLIEAAAAAGYVAHTWDVAQGVADIAGKPESIGSVDPGETLNAIRDRANRKTERGAWIMRDLPPWLAGQPGAPAVRQLRNQSSTASGPTSIHPRSSTDTRMRWSTCSIASARACRSPSPRRRKNRRTSST